MTKRKQQDSAKDKRAKKLCGVKPQSVKEPPSCVFLDYLWKGGHFANTDWKEYFDKTFVRACYVRQDRHLAFERGADFNPFESMETSKWKIEKYGYWRIGQDKSDVVSLEHDGPAEYGKNKEGDIVYKTLNQSRIDSRVQEIRPSFFDFERRLKIQEGLLVFQNYPHTSSRISISKTREIGCEEASTLIVSTPKTCSVQCGEHAYEGIAKVDIGRLISDLKLCCRTNLASVMPLVCVGLVAEYAVPHDWFLLLRDLIFCPCPVSLSSLTF